MAFQLVGFLGEVSDASVDRSTVICFLCFFDGSTSSLARIDQTDVGLSGALRTGLGFFGHPNAAPPDPLHGEVCPVACRARLAAFPCSVSDTG